MSSKVLKILLPLVVLTLAAVVALQILASEEDAPLSPRRAPAPLVRSLLVQPRDVTLFVDSQGTVSAPIRSMLSAEVPGRIEWVAPSLVAGGFFEPGDELLRIDQRDHELAVVLARAEVARAELALDLEAQEARVARDEWDDLEQGPPPPLVAREPQQTRARAELAAARARLSLAELDLQRTVIRAPFAGRVVSRDADLGQVVGAGTVLAQLYGIARAEVRLPVGDGDLAFLDLSLSEPGGGSGRQLAVTLSAEFAGQHCSWSGTIVRSEGQIDPRNRMLHLVASVEDPYGRLESTARPPLSVGLFVSARIEGRQVDDVIVLPRSALRSGSTVIVIDKQRRLHFRQVQVLRVERDRVLLSGGLSPGERVCLSTLEAAVEGMTVATIDAGDEPGAHP